MRMSPARAHFLRKTAESESATPNRENLEGLKGYDLVLAQLKAHQRQLKQLQSIERRIEFKRNNFDQYRPWIEGSLATGSGVQDTVISTMLIWAIDIGDYETALKIAQYILMHDLAMPEQFTRTPATALVEELAEAAKKARDQKQTFDAEVLKQANELTAEYDMPDPVRAKLLRELGELIQETEPTTALEHYNRAISLDSQCGAKGLRDKLEKQLGKQAEPDEQNK
ncbi:terminase [Mannheimia granulomatis]|uniref:Terminase n=1 Tax=Mannheimia granulomatis TaxID=85402 RepID=A0A011NAP6_9PAST|nr:terminase endonuclease subunit [Mannheimia granulomatis]EXI61682.1 terminase [Mannheimia granulomatis]RGE48263.1 terminase [Mannheimia granulomatis]